MGEDIIAQFPSPSFRQPFEEFRHAGQARSGKTRALFEYWDSLCVDGLPPSRQEIDAVRMRAYLPSLLMGEISPDPFRVFFRLVGTAVASYSNMDFSSRYLDELSYRERDAVEWHDCYRYVHAHHIGVIGDNVLKGAASGDAYEYAILPLRRGDDPAGGFIAIEVYDGINYDAVTARVGVTLAKKD